MPAERPCNVRVAKTIFVEPFGNDVDEVVDALIYPLENPPNGRVLMSLSSTISAQVDPCVFKMLNFGL